MSQSFKIFLFVVLSFFTSFNLSANDTFFSIEKEDARVYDLAEGVDDLALALKKKLPNLDGDVLEALKRDFPDRGLQRFVDNPKLVESWKRVVDAIPNSTGTTAFARDIATLEKVSELTDATSSFRKNFPNTWEQELKNILNANKDLRCATCGGLGITRVPQMTEMLDNVEHIMQFGNKPGFNSIMTNLKSNVNNRDGIHHMINYMKNNPDEFANVIEFEFRYADDIMNKADVLVGNVKYEFKSWTPDIPNPWNSFFSGSGDSHTQMIRYFGNSTNLNQVKYVFNGSKATETQVKNAFKNLFVSKADDMFKPISQGGLGEVKMKQLFEFDNFQFQNATEFKGLLNNNQTFRDNALKFITVD